MRSLTRLRRPRDRRPSGVLRMDVLETDPATVVDDLYGWRHRHARTRGSARRRRRCGNGIRLIHDGQPGSRIGLVLVIEGLVWALAARPGRGPVAGAAGACPLDARRALGLAALAFIPPGVALIWAAYVFGAGM